MREYFLSLIRGERRGLWASLQRGGLGLASYPYGWVMQLRNLLYSQGWKSVHHAPVPVVSIGNLTVGGTGKTPCVEYVARFFRQRDLRVAILSRGYGQFPGGEGRDEGAGNDEARVLEENLPDVPHLQGPDRVVLARIACAELSSEILVLDDGFQHRRLYRDLDVVLVDATQPWGFDYLLPRGLLREPVSSLRRADLVVLTRCDQVGPERINAIKNQIRRIGPQLALVETSHRPAGWSNAEKASRSLDDFKQRPVAAFCGIGNPAAFARTLEHLGLAVRTFRTYPDHHAYSREDVEELRAWARGQAPEVIIVTTQKDLVKLPLTRLGDHELWALRIQMQVEAGQEILESRLQEVRRRRPEAGG